MPSRDPQALNAGRQLKAQVWTGQLTFASTPLFNPRLTWTCVFFLRDLELNPDKDGQMKRTRFGKKQILSVLKQHEAGVKTAALARKHRVSKATIYNWKAKFERAELSEVDRLRALEEENAKLKKLLLEQMLEAATLRDVLSKSGTDRR